MKFPFLKYFFAPFLTSVLLLSGCKSQHPAFSNSSAAKQANVPATNNGSTNAGSAPAAEQPAKTVGVPAPKLVYDSTKVSFKIKQKTETETFKNSDDNNDEDDEITVSKSETVEKYRKREKEQGNWLSGGFLAAGMILLATALVLAIIGSGPAGLLAIIGGSLFLAGFIFTLVALLSR